MRKIIAVAVALALLLSACATTPATTDEETTTQAPIELTVPMQGENGITWRTLDLDDEANVQLRAWLESEGAQHQEKIERITQEFYQRMELDPLILRWGNGIYTRNEIPSHREIVLVNEATGEETVLLRARCTQEPPHGLDEYEDCLDCVEVPRFTVMLSERYFLFKWMTITGVAGHGVYDIQTLREYPIDLANDVHFLERRDGTLYWTSYEQEGRYGGQLSLYAANIANLPTLEPVDLLAGIAHEPVELIQTLVGSQLIQMSLLTQDERFYVITCISSIIIVDLREQRMFRLPKHAFDVDLRLLYLDHNMPSSHLDRFFLRDDNTIIWFSDFNNHHFINGNIAVELILP